MASNVEWERGPNRSGRSLSERLSARMRKRALATAAAAGDGSPHVVAPRYSSTPSTSIADGAAAMPRVAVGQCEASALAFEHSSAEQSSEGASRRASTTRSRDGEPTSRTTAQEQEPAVEAQAAQLPAGAAPAAESEQPAAPLTKAASLARLKAMLMRGTGAPVASGLPAAAAKLSPELTFRIDEAANALFDEVGLAAVQASAGQIDREEARAYLVVDSLADGGGLIEHELARDFGNNLRKAAARLDTKVKAAIKAAGRRKGGPDKEAVIVDALRGQPPMELQVPAPRRRPPPPLPVEPTPPPPPKPLTVAERWLRHHVHSEYTMEQYLQDKAE
jgi:hypothetical protein